MMIRILWVILGGIAAYSTTSKAAATEEAPSLEATHLSGNVSTPSFSPMYYSPTKPAASPTFALDERKCAAAAQALDERSFISPATTEEDDKAKEDDRDSLTLSISPTDEVGTYYSFHDSVRSLDTASETNADDAASVHSSYDGSVGSGFRGLHTIPETEVDEDEATEVATCHSSRSSMSSDAGTLYAISEDGDEDAEVGDATEVDTYSSYNGSVGSSARRLSIIPELEDEDDAEEPTPPLGATRPRLDTLLKNMDIGTLIGSTSEGQRIFLFSLAFEAGGLYNPAFYSHPKFWKLLNDIERLETTPYSLWELYTNIGAFFRALSTLEAPDTIRHTTYVQNSISYNKLAIKHFKTLPPSVVMARFPGMASSV